jgi:phenylacetate-CoA ligase
MKRDRGRSQPLIRYELSDIAVIESSPCPCGRTLRLVALEGRSDDVLPLRGIDGREVHVHPLAVRSPFQLKLIEVRRAVVGDS